jgi:hypothetical protein
VRLLGRTVGELMKIDGRVQLGLFPEDRRYRELLATVDRIREAYGHASLLPAGALREERSEKDERSQETVRSRSAAPGLARVGRG